MRVRFAVVVGFLGVVAASVAGVPAEAASTRSTQVVESFDGTSILTHLFVPAGAGADDPVPLVLRTHGWGGTGDTGTGGFVGDLLDAGYAVLTWDQRGFGCSGGEVDLDDPAIEGRDVSALIDWAVEHAPIAVDAAGDPLVGMTGGSYAGGIQTAAASIDPRIDVIAPEVSWHDLREVLYAGEVTEQGWALLLYAAGTALGGALGLQPTCPTFPQVGALRAEMTRGIVEGVSTGIVSSATLGYLARKSLGAYGDEHPVAVPTLVVQGSTDTLFDLTQGYRIFDHVRSQGVPARLLVVCGGHVACPASYGDLHDADHANAAILAWLRRWLDGDTTVDTGPVVEYRTNEGVWRAVPDFAAPGGTRLTATGAGSVLSIPVVDLPDVDALIGSVQNYRGGIPQLPVVTGTLNPAGDPRAFSIELGRAVGGPLDVVGIPSVSVRATGLGTEIILMGKLVHREAGAVVNLQEGAVRVPLLGGGGTAELPMPGVAYTLPEGHHLDLQISTASLMHSNARLPAQATVQVTASVPAVSWAEAAPPVESPAGPAPATPADPATEVAAGGSAPSLPATGGPAGLLAAGAAVLAAVATRRTRRR